VIGLHGKRAAGVAFEHDLLRGGGDLGRARHALVVHDPSHIRRQVPEQQQHDQRQDAGKRASADP
jgi:hypothetical protein